MAWLSPPENITTGWSPGIKYDAPSIGGLVGDILQQRRFEQKNLQDQMSNLAKTIQQQRQDAAFGEQASNAGLLPGVDTSGMSAAQVSNLAKLIQEQGSEATLNAQRQAMAKWIGEGKPLDPTGRAGGAASTGKEWVQDANGNWHLVTGNLGYKAGQGDQGNPYADRYSMVTTPDVVTYWSPDYSKKLSTQEAETSGNAVAVLPDKTSMPYADYKKMAGQIVNKYYSNKAVTPSPGVRQSDTDQAQQRLDEEANLPAGPSAPPPADYNQSIPTPSPTPPLTTAQPSGAQTGIAQSWDDAQPGQLYRAPDGTLRRRGG